MEDVSALRLHEVETYFNMIAGITDQQTLRARAYHNLARFSHEDYLDLAGNLSDIDASATFALLGRDMDELGPTVEALHAEGQEVALHGFRHIRGAGIAGEVIRENLASGLDAIEDAAGVRPTGYFPPIQDIGTDGLEAASELGLKWVFGKPSAPVPDDLTIVEPVNPYDMKLISGGDDPETALQPLFEDIEDGRSFLFHPNMLEYYGAIGTFDEWLAAAGPVSIGEQLTAGGVGVVMDANRPIRIE